MRVSEEDSDLIRASFRAVSLDGARAAEAFYRHLFLIDPATRRLFVADMHHQGVKLMSTLGVIVAQVQHWEMLSDMVEDLAVRHLAYGVRPEHYTAVGGALQHMFEERLGDAFSPEAAAAWTRAYAALSAVMVAATYPLATDLPDD